MGKKLYVGNLDYGMDTGALEGLFAAFGTVASCNIITDKFSGKSKGFGFVEMGSDEEAQKALDELNGKDNNGRPLKVDFAKEGPPRGRGGGGGRGGFGGGRGGSGGRGGFGGGRGGGGGGGRGRF